MGPQRLKLADVLAFLAGETVGYKHWWADPTSIRIGDDLTWTWRARKPRGVYYDRTRTFPLTYTDKDEAWEAMMTRGLIPREWEFNPSRRFVSTEYPGTYHRPDTLAELASFLSFGSPTIERVEELTMEASRRLESWGQPPLKEILWQGVRWSGSESTLSMAGSWCFFDHLGVSNSIWSPFLAQVIDFNQSNRLPRGKVTKDMRWTGMGESMLGSTIWDQILRSVDRDPATPNVFDPILAIYNAGFGFYRLSDGKATILYTLLGP